MQAQTDDIELLKTKMDMVINHQDEMRKNMSKLLERSEIFMGSGRGNGAASSGLGTPIPTPLTKNKNVATPDLTISPIGDSGGNGRDSGGVGKGTLVTGYDHYERNDRGGWRYEYWNRKIDMPLFDGSDPDGWILQSERYFAIYQLLNEEKVDATWSSLEQTSTTTEYIRNFVEMAAPLEGVSERIALASFVKGLRLVIKNELQLWAP
ncbi:hypothetical protein LXL04_019632 [Taraxacum kok-saghyz]